VQRVSAWSALLTTVYRTHVLQAAAANKGFFQTKAKREEEKKAHGAKSTNGYRLYLAEQYSAVSKDASLAEMIGSERTKETMRRIGAAWKALPDADKEPYNERARQEREKAKYMENV
jgi:hypothetical protein